MVPKVSIFLSSVSEQGNTSLLVFLAAAKYSDNGGYVCTATVRETNSSEAQIITTSFYVQIIGTGLIDRPAYTHMHKLSHT